MASHPDRLRRYFSAGKILQACAALAASLVLLTGLTGYWMIASQTGARFVLTVLEHFTGIQTQDISGSLLHDLHIRHLVWHEKQFALQADDVDLQWQPGNLIHSQIQLDQLGIGNLELALAQDDGSPATLPKSLQLPAALKLLQIDSLRIAQFQLSTLEADQQHTHEQRYSALDASLTVNPVSYAVQLKGTTPWGQAAIKGTLATEAPFAVQAQLHWQGLALSHDELILPETSLSGSLQGNLTRMQLQAHVDAHDAAATGTSGGQIQATLTPFSVLPLAGLQLDFSSLDPTRFYRNAPRARLNLKADFNLHGTPQAPILSGQISVANQIPSSWNSGGVPLLHAVSKLSLSEREILWSDARLELGHGGVITGNGKLVLHPASVGSEAVLPGLQAQFALDQIDLLCIDSRLKPTSLRGKVQVGNHDQILDFILDLQEANPALNAVLHAQASLDPHLKLSLHDMTLTANDAMVTAQGSVTLEKNPAFMLKGEAHNFNPARWLAVPQGHISTRFNLDGLAGRARQFNLQISELGGQFAAMDLHGAADFQIIPETLLSIQKLQLDWGRNHLSASGKWQLGTHLNPRRHEQLQINVAVPDLAALSRPFEKIVPLGLQGSVFAQGVLTGNAAQPAGRLGVQVNQLVIPNRLYLDHLQADLMLDEGGPGQLDGKLDLSGLSGSAPVQSDKTAADDGRLKVLTLHAALNGVRHAHTLQLAATLPAQQQFILEAKGDLQESGADAEQPVRWNGQISAMNLLGPLDFRLLAPFHLNLSSQSVQMGEASWQGKLGRLHVRQADWINGQIVTSGQFQEIGLVRALKFWRADLPVSGDLQLDSDWQLQIGPQMSGQIRVRRTAGDLLVQDLASGHGQWLGLGLQKLLFSADLGNHGHTLHQPVALHLQVLGDQLGQAAADMSSYISRTDQGWELSQDAALSGLATLQIKDIRWMSQLFGPGINLHGALDARAELKGVIARPDYRATLSGHELQIALTELGILLPNGKLDAVLEADQFRLNALTFSETIRKPPIHDGLLELDWLHQTGAFQASGSVNLRSGQGLIAADWQRFPFMQGPSGWLVASGQAQLTETGKIWNLTGKLGADAAYFSVPKQAAPRLSADVVVLQKNELRSTEKTVSLQSSLDFSISTGDHFIFVGRGLDTRLDGEMRIRSKNGGPFVATGNIRTAGGTYEGYGQKLDIERGILNFQGAVDNPGLNVRAIRRGLAVEAGVEVVGTVARPEVHLVSEPNLPDPDKLSWMVLGRGSEQMAGSEATVLMSAAGAIFGGENASNIPATISRRFGLEGLSFGTTSTAPGSQLPMQTVAGAINGTTTGEQAFSVGKRIAPNLVFSIERSLTDASNGLKLTWQLTRQFSIIGRAGSDTAIDGQYLFSFD